MKIYYSNLEINKAILSVKIKSSKSIVTIFQKKSPS